MGHPATSVTADALHPAVVRAHFGAEGFGGIRRLLVLVGLDEEAFIRRLVP